MLKKKYLKYANYRDQTIEDIFTKEQMKGMISWTGNELRTSVIINQGGGKFEVRPLPVEAQFSPVYGILIEDFDKDGAMDILVAGNFDYSKPEAGSYLGSYGALFAGDGALNFKFIPSAVSGLHIDGQVRDCAELKVKNQRNILISRNNNSVVLLHMNRK